MSIVARIEGLDAVDDAAVSVRAAVLALAHAARLLEADTDGLDPLALQVSAVGASLAVTMNAVEVAARAERAEL